MFQENSQEFLYNSNENDERICEKYNPDDILYLYDNKFSVKTK